MKICFDADSISFLRHASYLVDFGYLNNLYFILMYNTINIFVTNFILQDNISFVTMSN